DVLRAGVPLMRTIRISIGLAMLVFCLALIGACQSQPQPPASQAARADPGYLPTATIKDLMLSIVDPSADVVWLSVTTIVDDKGHKETTPQTREEWVTSRCGE